MVLELVKTERHIDRSKFAVYDFKTVDEFLEAQKISSGIQCVSDGPLPIDMHFTAKDSRTMIVVLHGAAERKVRLPWLSGQGVTKGLVSNRLFISDPSMYLSPEMNLSWFAGNYAQPTLQHTLVQIIGHAARLSGSDRLVFLGGSGGGFAALTLSYAFPGSLAVVMNPQINLLRYQQAAVDRYLLHCWNGAPFSALPPHIITDLHDLYGRHVPNTVAYLQNDDDKSHIDKHLHPLLDILPADAPVGLMRRRWGRSHVPPPRDYMHLLMQQAVAVDGDWLRFLDNENFSTVIEYQSAYRGALAAV